jgi:hypothetical protein
VPLVVTSELGHSNLGITSVLPSKGWTMSIIDTVHTRRAPMIPVSTWLRV